MLLAVAACQQPAPHLDIDVADLPNGDATAEVTPVRVTRASFEAPAVPPPSATATLERAARGRKGLEAEVTLHVTLHGGTSGELAAEFVTPDGDMYQRQAQAVAEAPFDAQGFDFTLPVAGTWIEAHQLFGEWRAHVLLGPTELLSEPFILSHDQRTP